MVKVQMSGGVGGKWLDKKELASGDVIKLTTEAQEVPSQQGGMQLVAKALVKGGDKEAKNLAINTPSKNALIQAFGDDTQEWVGKLLSVHVEKTVIAGKRGIALYLIPEGFEQGETDDGYIVVRRKGSGDNLDPKAIDRAIEENNPFE